MSQTSVVQGSSPPGLGVVPGWALWSLRILVLLTTIAVFVQPVLAGAYLMGDPGMREWHLVVGHALIPLLIILMLVAAILLWRPGRGASWPIWASIGLFFLAQTQAFLGVMAKINHWPLGVHIPVGALLFGVMVVLMLATWSPRLRGRRSRPKRDVRAAAAAGGAE